MTISKEQYHHPEYLVETDWLEQNLNSDNLRVFDCTVNVTPNPDSNKKKQIPFAYQSGIKNFKQAHILGAGFIDILSDLSDESANFPLVLPPRKKFIETMRNSGINNDSRVILYSSTETNWAARVWWLMHAFGFNNAAILNGGWSKWKLEGRSISTEQCRYAKGDFTSISRPSLLSNKSEVLSAIGNNEIRIINSLPFPIYTGLSEITFGRKGRIADSVNVPFMDLHDPETGCYLPSGKLKKIFEKVDVDKAKSIIIYCGGGVAASNDAFALTLLGYKNVSVYDGSMLEWGNDVSLPMDMG